MRVALGILNKEIERLQAEIDFMGDGSLHPQKFNRLTVELHELLEAWHILKNYEIPKMDLTNFLRKPNQVETKGDVSYLKIPKEDKGGYVDEPAATDRPTFEGCNHLLDELPDVSSILEDADHPFKQWFTKPSFPKDR